MNVYKIHKICDNPLFEGFGMDNEYSKDLITFPRNWREHVTTWQSKSLMSTWQIRDVEGNVRFFNDYPCINLTHPAFSQRAVDLLGDSLKANGELLPVRHKLGIYYFFNCTRLANVIDVIRSGKDVNGIPEINELIFIENGLSDLVIFKDRAFPPHQFCTQRFVDRVQSAGLQGMIFIPVWPLPTGVTYHSERYRLCKLAKKWRPNPLTSLEIKGNTVVLRLCCQSKQATKKEIAAAEEVMTLLEKSLYDPNQAQPESYFGDVEGSDNVDFEIRIFLSAPDCDRLLAHIMPDLRVLPWPGKFYVAKRRCNFMDEQAAEEYVAVD